MEGLDASVFWTLTLGQVVRILRGRAEREAQAFERSRILNHELAGLVAMAMHNPSKLPPYRPVNASREVARQPTEHDTERIRAFFIALSNRSQ